MTISAHREVLGQELPSCLMHLECFFFSPKVAYDVCKAALSDIHKWPLFNYIQICVSVKIKSTKLFSILPHWYSMHQNNTLQFAEFLYPNRYIEIQKSRLMHCVAALTRSTINMLFWFLSNGTWVDININCAMLFIPPVWMLTFNEHTYACSRFLWISTNHMKPL